MTETYTVVGSGIDWLLACMPLAIVLGNWSRKRTLAPRQWRTYSLMMGFFLAAAIVDVPFEWVGGSMALFCGLSLIFRISCTIRYRYVSSLAILALGAAMIYLGVRPENRIVMRANALDFYSSGAKETIPKSGLVIDERRTKSWTDVRSKAWWHTKSGQDYGPDINGSDLYWGPHGLIRGDDLGIRVAAWAGVKPEVRE